MRQVIMAPVLCGHLDTFLHLYLNKLVPLSRTEAIKEGKKEKGNFIYIFSLSYIYICIYIYKGRDSHKS